MEPWMALPVALAVHFGLRWLAKTDTTAGRRLRASDRAAWEMEVERREQELAELRGVEPE